MAKKSIDIKYVKQLKSGDIEGFEQIYSFYKDSLYFFILSLVKNEADATDVMQEVFLKVITKIDSLKNTEKFHSWLFTLAYNHTMQLFRGKDKILEFENEFIEDTALSKYRPDELLDQNELIYAIIASIQLLPNKYIQIAQLYYFNEMTLSEVSRVLNIPKSTVKDRIKFIERTLQETLEEKGYSPSKYFSVALLPFMFPAMELLLNKNGMNSKQSLLIKTQVLNNMDAISTYKKKAKNMNSFVGKLVYSKFITALVAIVAISSVILLVINNTKDSNINSSAELMNKKSNQKFDYIHSVYYDKTPTRDNVTATVELEEPVQAKNIKILKDKQELSFTLENSKVTFEINENGTYTINVFNDTQQLQIENIDKKLPIVSKVEYKNNAKYVQVYFDDEYSRCVLSKSYAEYQGKKYTITEDGRIYGDFNESMNLHIFDKESDKELLYNMKFQP